jgi:hypothetical protein
MSRHHRRGLIGGAALIALLVAAGARHAAAVPFTTSYTDGANWGNEAEGMFAQGFSPSEVPDPDPALELTDTVNLDRFQFFKAGYPGTATNFRLAIINNFFMNLQTLTTSSPELIHGGVVGLSTNTIASAAAIPTGASITFNFDHIPLVYGNDYAALHVTEGEGGVLTPVRVPTLFADYVEDPPGSGVFRPESHYGDPEVDYFKSASNFINTNEFGSFLASFNAPYADANFIASFNLPPSDYNHDGAWNDADFGVWKNQFGQAAAGLDADGDLDGDVDGADFLFWQQRYGAPSAIASAASIPEPATLALAALAAGAALRRRRRA